MTYGLRLLALIATMPLLAGLMNPIGALRFLGLDESWVIEFRFLGMIALFFCVLAIWLPVVLGAPQKEGGA